MYRLLSAWIGRAVLAMGLLAAGAVLPAQAQSGKTYEFMTTSAGTGAYAVASGIANAVTAHSDVDLVVTSYAGNQVIVPLLSQGKGAFALLNLEDLHRAREGIKTFPDAHPNLRFVSFGWENKLGALATVESGIKSLKEVDGQRSAGVYTAQPTCKEFASALLANAGKTWDDLTVVPYPNFASAVRALGEGRVEISPCASVGSGITKEVASTTDIRFLSVDPAPEAVKRTEQHIRGLRPVLHKAGSSEGMVEDTYLFHYPVNLVTQADVPDDVVYKTVKAIWENLPDIQKASVILATWKQDTMAGTSVTAPYHPGAIKFYKEVGVWTDKMEAENQALLKESK